MIISNDVLSSCLDQKYTLIYDMNTNDLMISDKYLSISTDPCNIILGEWTFKNNTYRFNIYINIGEEQMSNRNIYFRKQLNTIIKCFIKGDSIFNNSDLLDAPIDIYFISRYFEYNTVETWGKVNMYL